MAFVLLFGWLAGCAVPEHSAERDSIDLTRGEAVTPWDAAQRAFAADTAPTQTEGRYDAPFDAGLARDAGDRPSRVFFGVTSLPQGGRYKPKNIGAIWVEDASGKWVKTLALWASVRQRYLGKYLAANTTRDVTDAVTSATLRMHERHEITWDLTDASGTIVSDGSYSLWTEVTDHDGVGQSFAIELVKSAKPVVLMPKDRDFFTSIELRYE